MSQFRLRTLFIVVAMCSLLSAVITAYLSRSDQSYEFSGFNAHSGSANAAVTGPFVSRASKEPTIAYGLVRCANLPKMSVEHVAYVLLFVHSEDTHVTWNFSPRGVGETHSIVGTFTVGNSTISLEHKIDSATCHENLLVDDRPVDLKAGRMLVLKFNNDSTSYQVKQRLLPSHDIKRLSGTAEQIYINLNRMLIDKGQNMGSASE